MMLTSLIKKNILVLVRARTSALIIVLGPLLVILLAGLAFDNSNTYSVKLGVFSSQYNDLSNSFVERLTQNNFGVNRYDTSTDCITAIGTGEINGCVVFSPGFALATEGANEITVHVDYSRINLVWTVLGVMTENVGGKTQELSTNLTGVILQTLDATKQELQKRRQNIIAYTTINDNAAGQLTKEKEQLKNIDLGYHADPAILLNISDAKGKVNFWNAALKSSADKALETASNEVSKLLTNVKGNANMTTTLLAADTSISILKEQVKNASDMSLQEFRRFNSLVTDITLALDATKAQLAKADSDRKNGIEQLLATSLLLDSALKEILSVQKGFDTIEQSIDSIAIKDAAAIVQPIKTVIKPVAAKNTYLNYIFPVLIVLIIMSTAILLAPTMILLEKTSPAAFRNFLSPVPHLVFVLGNFVSSFLLLGVQVLVILIISALFFSAELASSFLITTFVLLLIVAFFILLGMIIGYLFNSEETATLAAVTLASLLLFLSDVIIPLESMPLSIQNITAYNPLVLAGSLVRRAMLFGTPLPALLDSIMLMLTYVCVVVLGVILAEYMSHGSLLRNIPHWFKRKAH